MTATTTPGTPDLVRGVLRLLLRPWHPWLCVGVLMHLNLLQGVLRLLLYDPDIPNFVVVDWWLKFTAGCPTTATTTLTFLTWGWRTDQFIYCRVSYGTSATTTLTSLTLCGGLIKLYTEGCPTVLLLLRPWNSWLRGGKLMNLNLLCRVSYDYDCYYDPDIPNFGVVDWWIYILQGVLRLLLRPWHSWLDGGWLMNIYTAGLPTNATATLTFLTWR